MMDHYDEIARVAYDIFEREGMIHGRHFDHWVEAEIIVTTKYNDKTEQNNAEETKPKKKAATKTVAKKTEAKPKTAAKPKAKK
jgi:hypothetical protein